MRSCLFVLTLACAAPSPARAADPCATLSGRTPPRRVAAKRGASKLRLVALRTRSKPPAGVTLMMPGRLIVARRRAFPIDASSGPLDGLSFWIVVKGAAAKQPVVAIDWRLCAGKRTLQSVWLSQQMVRARVHALLQKLTRGAVFSVAHHLLLPAGARADSLLYTLHYGAGASRTFRMAVQRYKQKTRLRLPLTGPAAVLGGHTPLDPHRGEPSQWFAYDFVGVDRRTLAMRRDAKKRNSSWIGWGRRVVAPAAGKVVDARNDIVDNPAPTKHLGIKKLMARYGPDKSRVIGGNFVVIDHGNGEFSFLAHLRRGSVKVKRGDRVRRGQLLGWLGNSGNSDAPHLHYHLMACARLFHCVGLPSVFDGLRLPLIKGKHRHSPARGLPVFPSP